MGDISKCLSDELQRAKAAAWQAGFYAGQAYGADLQKYDPQWDPYGEPAPPENPYALGMGGPQSNG